MREADFLVVGAGIAGLPAAEGFFWPAGQGGFGLQTSPAFAQAVEAPTMGGDWHEAMRAAGVEPGMLGVRRTKADGE